MKRRFAMIMMAALLGSGIAYAEQVNSKGELVAMNSSSARLSQLERRLATVERDLQSQRDYVRSLERDLNDLRRRR